MASFAIMIASIVSLSATIFHACSTNDNVNISDLMYKYLYRYTVHTYSTTHTDILDKFVMENCHVKHKIVKDNFLEIPNEGILCV